MGLFSSTVVPIAIYILTSNIWTDLFSIDHGVRPRYEYYPIASRGSGLCSISRNSFEFWGQSVSRYAICCCTTWRSEVQSSCSTSGNAWAATRNHCKKPWIFLVGHKLSTSSSNQFAYPLVPITSRQTNLTTASSSMCGRLRQQHLNRSSQSGFTFKEEAIKPTLTLITMGLELLLRRARLLFL
jgi:hypothetical protein